MEHDRGLVIDHRGSVYNNRWLVIHNRRTTDQQRCTMDYDLRPMIDLGRRVVNNRWTVDNYVFLFLLRNLKKIDKL